MELASGVQGKRPVRRLRRASKDGRLEAHVSGATARHICCGGGPFMNQVHVGSSKTSAPATIVEAAAAAKSDDLLDVDDGIATTSTSNGKLQQRQLLPSDLEPSCPDGHRVERQTQVVEPDAAASRAEEEKRREAAGEAKAKEAIFPLLIVSAECASEATALHNCDAGIEHLSCMECARSADTAENPISDAVDLRQTSSKVRVFLISVEVSSTNQ